MPLVVWPVRAKNDSKMPPKGKHLAKSFLALLASLPTVRLHPIAGVHGGTVGIDCHVGRDTAVTYIFPNAQQTAQPAAQQAAAKTSVPSPLPFIRLHTFATDD
jgi:hypothetical protein